MVAGEPFYRDLFRFSGRRRRGSYFNFVITAGVLLFPINVLLDYTQHLQAVQMVLGGLMIVMGVASLAVMAQRCRDFGWTGWAAGLCLIPVVGQIFGIIVLFIPGARGENRYGPDPLAEIEASP